MIVLWVKHSAIAVQNTGITDQNINRAGHAGGDILHIVFCTDIQTKHGNIGILLGGGDQIGRLHGIAATGNHLVATCRGLTCHFKPDAATGTGNHDCSGHQFAMSSPMIEGSKGVRLNTSRSMGSKWLNGKVS